MREEMIDSKTTPPDKHQELLAYFNFCGMWRFGVVFWSEKNNEWRTSFQRNSINVPEYWQYLPTKPNIN